MNGYGTNTLVQAHGEIHLMNLPFQPGTEVKVTISSKEQDAELFFQEWQVLAQELRQREELREITDEEIEQEIRDYRASRQ